MRKFYSFLTISGLFFAQPASAQLTATNLPIVVITTNVAINNSKIDGNIKIIDNTSGINMPSDPPTWTGLIGVEYRGASTHPKRSYNVETWADVLGINSVNVSLMGMPEENDWVLLADYTDRSLMRNLFSFNLYEQMGYYAPRMRLCEVLVNEGSGDVYKGVYLFGEKIKRDSARVDIATLQVTDNAGEELTGGYIFTIDDVNSNTSTYWVSQHLPPYAGGSQTIKFSYDEPKWDEITPVQKAYIQNYVKRFEDSLASPNFQDTAIGWRAYGAIKWFRDYLIFAEITKSYDAYRKATYLYKDKSKKLRIGPPWGLEVSMYNTSDCDNDDPTGWAYMYAQACNSNNYLPPFWWEKLMTDTAFVSELKCRYTYLRDNLLDTATLYTYIDSVSSFLNVTQGGGTAQGRNFTQWPIWGVNLTNEPLGGAPDYPTEVARLKSFLQDRLTWLDSQWLTPGCTLSTGELLADDENSYISPNPANGSFNTHLTLNSQTNVGITIRNLQGAVVYSESYSLGAGQHQLSHDISQLANSMYIITIQQGEHSRNFKLVKN